MSIETEILDCRQGQAGVVTLNRPRAINALSRQTMMDLRACLEDWAGDPDIQLVILTGAGEKGFCAGGDIRELYDLITGSNPVDDTTDYFRLEYSLDHFLHLYPKPVICWGHGIVMGGGLGLLSASRYRIVTPTSQLAMPEVNIGLFPDVGAGWFLNRLPGSVGLFMGLTGARLNASDSLRIGLADFALEDSALPTLLGEIREQRWTGHVMADDNRLHHLLTDFANSHAPRLPDSHLAEHEERIARICRTGTLTSITQAISEEPCDSDWWVQARNNLNSGCPVTPWVVWEHLHRALQLSLEDVFRMELTMAIHCCTTRDLREGIRARVIDRDAQPQWQYPNIEAVPEEAIEAFFHSPWSEEAHPLADLELQRDDRFS